MGFFSYLTADTEESVSNKFSDRGAKTVYLLQPNGLPSVKEEEYEGYGEFGGINVFDWLEQHNPPAMDPNGQPLSTYERMASWTKVTGKPSEEMWEYPIKLSFNPKARYEDLPHSKSCPSQGYFYEGDSWLDELDD